MNLFSLEGQVAFVTGAGSGIGQAIAIGLADAGADVACFGHASRGGLEETADRIAGRRHAPSARAAIPAPDDDCQMQLERVCLAQM